MNILVTGSYGFIGSNLIQRLRETLDEKTNCIYEYNRGDSDEKLEEALANADLVYHLAGVNRPENKEEFYEVNHRLTKKIIDILEKTGGHPTIVFTSSRQVEDAYDHNFYAETKWLAEWELIEYSRKTGTESIAIYRLPNVFGKWSKPNYNTVVATFCYNVAHGIPLKISESDKIINFVYIDDVINEFLKYLTCTPEKKYPSNPVTYGVVLSELARTIQRIGDYRKQGRLLDLNNNFEKYLSAMYLDYVDKIDLSYEMEKKEDERGYFCELLKSPYAGQVSISTTKPGVTRGNHYHHVKTEKFMVLKGDAEIKLQGLHEDQMVYHYFVKGSDCKVIDIPPGYTHSITNIGEQELLTLFWANEIFNPEKPDTYRKEII